MQFRTLDQINLRGQRVFFRCDLNVPLDARGGVADDTRIRASLDGIRHALAHRAEATTEALARRAPMACAGPLMASELRALTRALSQPQRPLAAIVGGAKVSTKLAILKSLAEKVELLVVGGGMANTFLAASGHGIGKSLCEPDLIPIAQQVMATLKRRGAQLFLPDDVVTATECSESAMAHIKPIGEVAADDMILDFGPLAMRRLVGR